MMLQQFSKSKFLSLFTCISFYSVCLLFVSCTSSPQQIGYLRTKSMAVAGRISATKDVPVILLSWDFRDFDVADHSNSGSLPQLDAFQKSVDDCFRAELVYLGEEGPEALFAKKYYLCQRADPLGIEVERILPLSLNRLYFHGSCVSLISSGPIEAEIEIDKCSP